jgi:xanthine/uracil permease
MLQERNSCPYARFSGRANIFAKAAEAGIRWVRYYLASMIASMIASIIASMIVASAGQNLGRVRMKRVSG